MRSDGPRLVPPFRPPHGAAPVAVLVAVARVTRGAPVAAACVPLLVRLADPLGGIGPAALFELLREDPGLLLVSSDPWFGLRLRCLRRYAEGSPCAP